MDFLSLQHRRPSGATPEATEAQAKEPSPKPAARRPYRKPIPELRGQIKPSLLGSPPKPP